MTSIIDLCKEGFDPKVIGPKKFVSRQADKFKDKETKIISENELVAQGNKDIYYLYVK